jgi:hypothetical protein
MKLIQKNKFNLLREDYLIMKTPEKRLKESIIEMQKIRKGKDQKKTWKQFCEELKGSEDIGDK